MMENKSESVGNICISGQQQDKGWACLGIEVYVKAFVIGILLYLFFNEEISGVVRRWINDPGWSHGFLIPFFSLYFLNQNKDKILKLDMPGRFGAGNYLGLFLLICCLIFYPLNYVHFQIGYFLPLTVVAALGSVVLLMGGWKLVKYAWLAVLYLVFAIPLPTRLHREITMPMRQFAAAVAAFLLNLVNGMEAVARGVVIDVVYKGKPLDPPLDVAEACSGMRLLMAFLALGVAMAYLHYRPPWQRIILLCSTIPIAILCNVVRVTITGFIYILGDPKYARGIYHDALGMLMLPLAFGLYWLLAWFMTNLFVDEEAAADDDVVVRRPGGTSDGC